MGLLKTPMSAQRIELWSGGFLDLENPTESQISREDIVAGLSNTCRFAGQSRRFYSVAEHCVLVADLLRWAGEDERGQWAGLMHDAAEAFIGDVTAPLKYVLRQGTQGSRYDLLENDLSSLIYNQFEVDLDDVEDRPVGECDLWAFVIEAGALLPSAGSAEVYDIPHYIRKLGGLPNGVVWHAGLDPLDARDLFRNRWEELKP